jgi:hypothetical protein
MPDILPQTRGLKRRLRPGEEQIAAPPQESLSVAHRSKALETGISIAR